MIRGRLDSDPPEAKPSSLVMLQVSLMLILPLDDDEVEEGEEAALRPSSVDLAGTISPVGGGGTIGSAKGRLTPEGRCCWGCCSNCCPGIDPNLLLG